MRHLPVLSAALGALGLIAVSAAPAAAFTNTSPAGLLAGTQALDPVETVHCRRAVHKHRPGHGWGRGCDGGSVVIVNPPRRHGVIIRDGSRSGSGVNVNIRSGSGSAPASTSGSSPAATTGAAPQSAPAAKQSAPAATQSAPAATQSAPAAPQSAPAPKQ